MAATWLGRKLPQASGAGPVPCYGDFLSGLVVAAHQLDDGHIIESGWARIERGRRLPDRGVRRRLYAIRSERTVARAGGLKKGRTIPLVSETEPGKRECNGT